MRKDFLRFFETDASLPVCPQSTTLALIEAKSHEYNCYTAVIESPKDA
jgi:hypothetical protein